MEGLLDFFYSVPRETKMPILQNWKERYASKLMTAQQALLNIRSGSRVFLSPACGEPQHSRDLGRGRQPAEGGL